MSGQYAKFRFSHSIDIDDRTCDFVLVARVRRTSPTTASLLEIDFLDYRVTVYGLSGLVNHGSYDRTEAPDAEIAYWETAIKVELENEIRRRGTDFNWQDAEGEDL